MMLRLFCFIICSMVFFTTGAHAMEANQQVIILLGPPGSGKGTQAKQIVQSLHIPHISTGDIFRENISKKTPLGEKAKGYMDAGKLVPDDVVLDMLFDRVSKDDCKKGYLLDGFPRTIPQAEALDKFLKKDVTVKVINLKVSDDVIVRRIGGRLSCPDCGHVHNKYDSPPKTEGKCDVCGGTLIQRADDKPEVVKERLRVYNEQTAPLIDFYSKKGVLTTIDGEQGSEKVFDSIMSKLKS